LDSEKPPAETEKRSYVYILRCADGTLYTGWTNDLSARVDAHNSGNGAKYTKGRGPAELAYWESFDSKIAAMRREYQLKRRSRAEKLALIKGAAADFQKNA
jgi:putative endonuclease